MLHLMLGLHHMLQNGSKTWGAPFDIADWSSSIWAANQIIVTKCPGSGNQSQDSRPLVPGSKIHSQIFFSLIPWLLRLRHTSTCVVGLPCSLKLMEGHFLDSFKDAKVYYSA